MISNEEQDELMEKAHSARRLYLVNEVLYKVIKKNMIAKL